MFIGKYSSSLFRSVNSIVSLRFRDCRAINITFLGIFVYNTLVNKCVDVFLREVMNALRELSRVIVNCKRKNQDKMIREISCFEVSHNLNIKHEKN